MTLPDQGSTSIAETAEYIAEKLRASAETAEGAMLLSIAAIGMGRMMDLKGEQGEMSRKFLDALMVLANSPNKNDKILAAGIGFEFRKGKRLQDEEAGLFALPSQPASSVLQRDEPAGE